MKVTTYRENLSEVSFHRLPKSEVPYSRKSSASNGLRKSEVHFSEVRKCGANELENLGKLSEVNPPLSGDAATSAAATRPDMGVRPNYVREGQPYWRLFEMRPYTTRAGRKMDMEAWMTFCAGCGQVVEILSPVRMEPQTRRGSCCAAPGRKVGGRRKHP